MLVEILAEFTADTNRQVVLVDERLVQSADPALALQQLLPGVLGIGCEGIARREGCDDDVGKSVAGGLARHGPPKSFTQLADLVEIPQFTAEYAPSQRVSERAGIPQELASDLSVGSMTEIDLEALSTSTQGYTVNDEDDDDPILLDRTATTSKRGVSDIRMTLGCPATNTSE